MTVLAIDQGTSGTKALVVAPDGTVLGEGRAAVRPRTVGPGLVEQDPHELLNSIVAAGREALAAAGVPVVAVGLGNQGETVVALDPRTRAPLGPALSWQDRRAGVVTAELADRAERLTALSGLPLDPYFAAPKMTWLARRYPGALVTTVDAWLVHALTGAFVTDAATASRTMLLDLDAAAWSSEACDAFGLDPATLPEVVDQAGHVGTTDVFGPELPLTGLCVDQQAALFGERCLAAGEVKCTYGTGAFVLANAGSAPVRSSADLAACLAWRLDGAPTYCFDGQVYTAAAAVDWLQELGLTGSAAEVDGLCADANLGAEAVFVPALAGLGAPFWRPDARGGWVGLSLSTTRCDLVRAVVDGIAAQVACLTQAVADDLGAPLRALRVDGGLTRSSTLLQAQADLLQTPVEVYPLPDATALGIAAFARLGAGLAAGPEDAVAPWTPAAVHEPRMAAAEAAARLDRWRAAALSLAALPPLPPAPEAP